jgi:putative restriction endonuclease
VTQLKPGLDEITIAIAPTDIDWFNNLKEQTHTIVNFWTPTPWNIKKLENGDKLYFMLKKPIRKIGGMVTINIIKT